MPKANETKNVKLTAEPKKVAKADDAKKTTSKKPAAAKQVTESVCIQYGGREIETADILERAKATYAGDAKQMKDIRVYVKPEENMAYFVVNGDETGSMVL